MQFLRARASQSIPLVISTSEMSTTDTHQLTIRLDPLLTFVLSLHRCDDDNTTRRLDLVVFVRPRVSCATAACPRPRIGAGGGEEDRDERLFHSLKCYSQSYDGIGGDTGFHRHRRISSCPHPKEEKHGPDGLRQCHPPKTRTPPVPWPEARQHHKSQVDRVDGVKGQTTTTTADERPSD
jgi:hypothetical protein